MEGGRDLADTPCELVTVVILLLLVPVGPLVRFLEERGIEVTEARRIRPSLEEVFVQITGLEPDAMKKEKEKAGGGA